MFTIFTDGSCNFNKKGANNIGGYAFVILNEQGAKIQEYVGKELNTTNNRMELMAVIHSLEKIKHYNEPIVVFSDSQYVVNAINQNWIKNWEKADYKRGKFKKEIPNSDLWKRLSALLRPNITLKWCKGHTTTNIWNNYCDELVKKVYEPKFKVINA